MKSAIYAFYGETINTTNRLADIKQAGFSDIGVWLSEDNRFATLDDERQMLNAVQISGLAPLFAFAPKEQALTLTHKLYGVGEAMGKYKSYINTAADHGIEFVILEFKLITDELTEHLKDLAFFANEKGVKLLIENSENVFELEEIFEKEPLLGYAYNAVEEYKAGLEAGSLLTKYADKAVLALLANVTAEDDYLPVSTEGLIDFDLIRTKCKKASNLKALCSVATHGYQEESVAAKQEATALNKLK